MERLKQYSAAMLALAAAVVCVILGALALTVWSPAQVTRAAVTPANPIVMTRDGLFTLIGDDAKITATAPGDTTVALALGTTTDVKGWIGSDAYTEVIGLASDRTTLLVEEHAGTVASADQPQSADDAQSAERADTAQSAERADTAQSAEDAQSAQSGQTAQSGAATPTSVLTSDMWLEQAVGTGSVTLDLADIAPGRSVIATTDALNAELELTITWQTPQSNVLAVSTFLLAGIFGLIALALALVTRRNASRQPTPATEQVEDATAQVGAIEVAPNEATEPAEETTLVDEQPTQAPPASQTPAEETTWNVAHVGRHGGAPVIDVDPPERVTNDTGRIDLSAISPGTVLPSRRALRQAREQGQDRIVIDGREFDTGVIPVVAPTEDPTTPAQAEADTDSSWTSIMAGWKSRRTKGEQ